MRGRIRALLLAALVGVAMAACARGGGITAPEDGARMEDGATPDSTGVDGWGGFIGSGG